MRIPWTIVLTAYQLIAFLSATEYVFSTKCLCNGSLSDLQLHATVDHGNQSMTTYFTGIATNFSEQSLRAYPKMYKDETECNNLDEKTLRNETAESDTERQQNLGAEKIHKHKRKWRNLDPTTSVDETRSHYMSLFTGCYFFEYKPADSTCSTCYTNRVFINTSMEYVSLMPVQEARLMDKEYELIVTIPLQQMRIFVRFYERLNDSRREQAEPTVICKSTWAMSRNETVNQVNEVCDGNVRIAQTYDNGTEKWSFRMRWREDQNFSSVKYSWDVDSHPTIWKLHKHWDIPTHSSYRTDNFIRPPPKDRPFDLIWMIYVGVVGLVILLCISRSRIRHRTEKKKENKNNPEIEAGSEEKVPEPPVSDILLLYAPGNDVFERLIKDVKEQIEMHCQCRVYDYRRILEYSADSSSGPQKLSVDRFFNYCSSRIVWFDTPQLRARLRQGSNACTCDDFRDSWPREALDYTDRNHPDPRNHFVCRIKGIPEYAVTNESDSDNPLSWITRGVHYYLPDHTMDFVNMLSGKDITKNESLAENEATDQDNSNKEESRMNGYNNNRELGNNSVITERNWYFSKNRYEIVNINDN